MARFSNPFAYGPAWMNPDYHYAPKDEPEAEKKLFAGTLKGYRHFRVTRLGQIVSPAYGQYYWRDGENVSSCSHLDGNAGSFENWGRTLENQIASTEERIRELEKAIADEQHRRWMLRDGSSAWDISYSSFTSNTTRGDVYYQIAGEDAHKLHQLREDLRCYKAIEAERAKFARGEHRLKSCSCGFYVSYSPKTDFYASSHHQHVHAVVECYGKVVLGTKGFRAQKLKVVAMAPFHRPNAQAFDYDWANNQVTVNYRATAAERLPISFMADHVAEKFPSARFFEKWGDMLKEYPEPDRKGLVPDRESDYGA